ncbi:extracellular solute-binding protein [Haladaptatus sp. DYF46]|uniref:ABC transporter substrate-binding protein n=1 Tax=Haladaptatus sp. DYF46 TaxID=2886041 RepID=UPI001E56129D|nr:extracellular solute-binding protein [Haladaptatus sp. DYF46]
MAHEPTTRRRFLRIAGTGTIVAAAGCTDRPDDGGSDGGENGDGNGGGNGGGNGDQSKKIQYLSDRGDSKDVIDQIISEFEEKHDYTVEVTYTSKGKSTDEQLQKMKAAGNPPDIVFDTSADAYRYHRNGNLASVSDAVQGTGLPDPVNVGGESYFAATMVEPLMGWYRNDLFQENPTTWEKWTSEAKRVSEQEDIKGYVVQSGQTNNADTQITQYHWQNGVNLYSGPSDDIEVTIDKGDNRKRAVETYEWIQQMAEYSPNGAGWEWGDAIAALQQENAAAIMSVGGLPILTIASNRPDLVDKLSPTPFPLPSGEKQEKWWAYMEGHVVWKNGKATEGAKKFVDFFSKSDKFMDFVLSAPLFQFPPTKEMLDSDAVKNNETIKQHPEVLDLVRNNWDAFTSILATGENGQPNIVAADAYGQQVFGQSAEQMLVGGKSPEETVDWVAKKLRGLQE